MEDKKAKGDKDGGFVVAEEIHHDFDHDVGDPIRAIIN